MKQTVDIEQAIKIPVYVLSLQTEPAATVEITSYTCSRMQAWLGLPFLASSRQHGALLACRTLL
jgi:hypothetical protein